ncbi:serine hydrolase domain-containing protein [Sphingobacterium hungaricum]
MGNVALTKDGNLIYERSVGFSDAENNVLANQNTKYRVGSISKTFTSVLIMQAVEDGKLKLDALLSNYFPTVINADKINIRNMLNHSSGIASFTNSRDYTTWNTQPKSEQELLNIIVERGSKFEPNSKSEYSNSNYVLLTFILEKVYGKPYAKLIEEKIAKPLNLSNTYVGGKIDVSKNEAKSYSHSGKWIAFSETDMSIPLGAGAIVSTATDLTTFANALFSEKLVNAESFNQMTTFLNGFGLGLFQYPFGQRIGFGHGGGIDAFSSSLVYYDDGNISYALTSNGGSYSISDIGLAVLNAAYGVPFVVPTFHRRKLKLTAEQLDPYLGVYSSSEISLKITTTQENATLYAQATGQDKFPLDATELNVFEFDPAGIVLEFDVEQKTMILKQSGAVFHYKKD